MATTITDRMRKAFYLDMLRIRVIEDELAAFYAEQEMRCPVHFCTGQEAVSVAVCRALRKQDTVMSTHRCHGHYLAKDGDLKAMVAELYGKAPGCASGKGGSMHLIDRSVNFLAATSIVASTIPVATGVAFSNKLKKRKSVSTVFFGDAATEEGLFYESMNFAALHKLPVLFICENNFYSVYTPLHKRQPASRSIYKIARSLGAKSAKVFGNDVEAVYRTTVKALKSIRSGGGPYLIEADTYRYLEHCGPNCDIEVGYRTKRELIKWQKRDPVSVYERKLLRAGLVSERLVKSARQRYTNEVREAVAFAKAAPFPVKGQMAKDVYAE
jgi:pyruvate dehydrogenase E1 component alpha subunit